MKISVINGPNINLLGMREIEHYGNESLDVLVKNLMDLGNQLGIGIDHFQSNHEGEIVDYIQSKLDDVDGFVLNPAGLSKTGYSILDALNAKKRPFIEVHLSNIFTRGEKHTGSIFTDDAIGLICGFKGYGYIISVLAMHEHIRNKKIK